MRCPSCGGLTVFDKERVEYVRALCERAVDGIEWPYPPEHMKTIYETRVAAKAAKAVEVIKSNENAIGVRRNENRDFIFMVERLSPAATLSGDRLDGHGDMELHLLPQVTSVYAVSIWSDAGRLVARHRVVASADFVPCPRCGSL